MELLLVVILLLILAGAAYQFIPHPLGQFIAFAIVVVLVLWVLLALGDGLTVGDGER